MKSWGLAGALGALIAIAGCATEKEAPSTDRLIALDAGFESLLDEHGMATAGAGIIEDGALVWTGYYGEQSDGVPATSETLFNVASVTKTVAAETIVRLAAKGALSLDEPMASHWVDPDLVDDPRHLALTPRMALNHSTGFPNWRYSDPQFRLRFQNDPGTAYGYSGEGFEYVARFAEEKVGKGFEELVQENILDPESLGNTIVSPKEWALERIALPVADDGTRRRPFCTGADEFRCRQPGDWSAADEMATTVEDYAGFLISVMEGDGLTEDLMRERFVVATSSADDPFLRCPFADLSACPQAQGFGLGWEVFDFGDQVIAGHSGNDWSERAMVYFDVETRDGIILFLNGPNSRSTEALIDGMNLLDPGSPIANLYRGWMDAFLASQSEE